MGACTDELRLTGHSDDLYNEVTARFLRRLNDKEASIRQHAVIGLAKLQSSDEGGEGDSEGDEIVEALLNLLQHDPSSEVRRAVLLNLEQTRITLPYILERARDTDSVNRRMVYSRCLKQLGSFKYLSIKKREKLLSWGLQDRDESVVAAAARMFAHDWLETAENNIIDLLERLDVVSSKIAPRALRVFFQERPEACAQIDMIDSEIWQNLTPESALLARVFNEHGHAKGNEHLDVESKLPETSQLAAYIESQISQMLHCREEGEELRFSEHAFMVEQLFRIALTGDFADEMGRRRMFPLMRAVLTDIRMPDNIIKMAVKVLSCISGSSESYLVGIIMEILSDIEDSLQPRPQQQESSHRSSFGGSEVGSHHAGDSSNSSFHSAQSAIASSPAPGSSGATPVSAARGKRMLTPVSDVSHEESPDITEAITIRLRCLLIVRQTLEGLRKGPQDNSQLLNLFESIIVPCVRDHNAAVREHGLQCLGLYASLSEKETVENFALFAHCLAKGHESLQIVAIETITDLLVCHGAGILQRSDIGITELQFLNLLARALTADELPSLQATTVVAVCKLLLLNLLPSSELLEILMFVYFDPATAQNLLLRQALSYFFPVYCFSAAAHQALAAKAVIPAFHKLAKLALQLEADDGAPSGAAGAGDDERMTPLPSILAQMVDWTNPARLAHQEAEADAANADQMSNPHLATHLDMALAMVRQIQASRYRK